MWESLDARTPLKQDQALDDLLKVHGEFNTLGPDQLRLIIPNIS